MGDVLGAGVGDDDGVLEGVPEVEGTASEGAPNSRMSRGGLAPDGRAHSAQ